MQLKKHVLPILIALALALTAVGCGAKTPEPETSIETEDTSITFEATGVRADEVVATLGDIEAPAELLTYQIGYVCSYLDYMMQAYGLGEFDINGTLPNGENALEYVRREALTLLKQQLLLEQLAAENGVALSADDEAALAAQREADLAEYGEETYLAQLRSMGLSEAGYDRVARASYLYQALAASGTVFDLSDDALAAHAADEGYVTADHILLMTVDPDTYEPLDDETVALQRATAESLLEQLRASDDPVALFTELADAYSEDPGHQTNPTGYTFTYGTMVDSFDSAARALEENEFSDIVESEYGFHILLRRPLNAEAAADAVRDDYFDDLFLELVDGTELTLTPAADRLDPVVLYPALHEAQGESFGS